MKKLLVTISILLTLIVSQSFAFANPFCEEAFISSENIEELLSEETTDTANDIVDTLAPVARELASIEEVIEETVEEVVEVTEATASLFTLPTGDDDALVAPM